MALRAASLTRSEISRSSRRVSRPKNEHEPAYIRFKPGTKARVEAVLIEGETHASFVNEAVNEKIARRTKAPSRRAKTPPQTGEG